MQSLRVSIFSSFTVMSSRDVSYLHDRMENKRENTSSNMEKMKPIIKWKSMCIILRRMLKF